jgi:hexosaminidase
MKKITFLLLLFPFIFSNCDESVQAEKISVERSDVAIIPQPMSLVEKEGYFEIKENTSSYWENIFENEARFLLMNLPISYVEAEQIVEENGLNFILKNEIEHDAGYEISITPQRINVYAKTATGAFYATQTLRQLNQNSVFPCVEIKDQPRFAYRGMHLDVARHFFDVDAIKKYIDLLAYHKFNRFHWHLTEDQGWRIEIKKYPKLQEISAYRKETLIGHYSDQPQQFDGTQYGGFYTQEEVKEVVKYAQDRHVIIIPEIEMPGHSQAVLAAYPEFGCVDKKYEVATQWGIFEDVYCPKEETFQFLEDVLTEVMALFPSEYIHIGGDECPKTQWKESAFCQKLIQEKGLKNEHGLQSYFIGRMEAFLNKNGRQIIGWDEILEGGLAPNATVMSWRGEAGGIEAAKQKHDVIMTPTTYCYLDYYQSQNEDEPTAIGGFLPLKKVYNYEPIPEELTAAEAKYILGIQGNVWTEYMPTIEQVFYMAYPRACALAEIGWSPQGSKDYSDFTKRLLPHLKRLQAMGIEPANHLSEVQMEIESGLGNGVLLEILNEANLGDLHFTKDGKAPTKESPIVAKPLEISENTTISTQVFVDGQPQGEVKTTVFDWHKAAGKKIEFTHLPHKKYSGNGLGSVVNAVQGSNERYNDAEWLGFDGKDTEMVIDLGEKETFNRVKIRFYEDEGQWIYLPKSITLSTSDDGETYIDKVTERNIEAVGKIAAIDLIPKEGRGRFLKIKATNFGMIPDGAQGAGNRSWLFLDEVRVE